MSGSPTSYASIAARWPRRLRWIAAAGLLTGALYGVAARSNVLRGAPQPVVLVSGGVLETLRVGCLLLAGGAAAALIAGSACDALTAFGTALALWACMGGTMDAWLTALHPVAGPQQGMAYARLIPDYLVLAGVTALVYGLGAAARCLTDPVRRREALRDAFRPGRSTEGAGEWREGLLALGVTCAVAGSAMLVLTGPRVGPTYRGQVLFAVVLSFILGVWVARRASRATHPLWFWPAPLIVGVLGLALAAWRPGLPPPYEHINLYPAFGLVRGLPVEVTGAGLAATIWMLGRAAGLRASTS